MENRRVFYHLLRSTSTGYFPASFGQNATRHSAIDRAERTRRFFRMVHGLRERGRRNSSFFTAITSCEVLAMASRDFISCDFGEGSVAREISARNQSMERRQAFQKIE